jgi:hypothetical protein
MVAAGSNQLSGMETTDQFHDLVIKTAALAILARHLFL